MSLTNNIYIYMCVCVCVCVRVCVCVCARYEQNHVPAKTQCFCKNHQMSTIKIFCYSRDKWWNRQKNKVYLKILKA